MAFAAARKVELRPDSIAVDRTVRHLSLVSVDDTRRADVILEIAANAAQIGDRLDAEVSQLRSVADTGQHQKARAVDRPGRDDHFVPCPDAPRCVGGYR